MAITILSFGFFDLNVLPSAVAERDGKRECFGWTLTVPIRFRRFPFVIDLNMVFNGLAEGL
jgi:hypothetical protein